MHTAISWYLQDSGIFNICVYVSVYLYVLEERYKPHVIFMINYLFLMARNVWNSQERCYIISVTQPYWEPPVYLNIL